MDQQPYTITCPFCWESLDILLDPSVEHQRYTEDCQVCCHPIALSVTQDGHSVHVDVERE
ncbi:MAG: CPXCG motif-containing cysteine-rich protein [Pseudomonadota bacterium]